MCLINLARLDVETPKYPPEVIYAPKAGEQTISNPLRSRWQETMAVKNVSLQIFFDKRHQRLFVCLNGFAYKLLES